MPTPDAAGHRTAGLALQAAVVHLPAPIVAVFLPELADDVCLAAAALLLVTGFTPRAVAFGFGVALALGLSLLVDFAAGLLAAPSPGRATTTVH